MKRARGRRAVSNPCALSVVALAWLLSASAGLRAEDAPRGEAIAATGMPGPYGERLTIDDKGITLRFPDDAATLRIGGRLHLDFGAAGIRQSGFDDPFSDNFAVRRSWIETSLSLGKDVGIGFQYDFADPTTPINDAVIVYRGVPDMLFSVGNQREPFGLDQLASNNSILFTERALSDAFVPARNVGFAVGRHGKDWSIVTGIFGGNANTGIGSEGIASTSRVTYAPIDDDKQTLHLGLAGSFRSLHRNENPLSLSSRSEAFLFTRSFVDTDDLRDAASIARIGAELAYRSGPLLVSAEFTRTDIGRFGAGQPLHFQGGYVQASWVLNGDNRAYRMAPDFNGTSYAVFGGVKVAEAQRITRGGIGVFELGLRFSAIDLDDGEVRGGIEQDGTVGLSWYPDTNIRIIADYVRSHTSPSALRNGRTIDADTFIGRFQLYW
ncbi:OprO/OprP family phosphate-selective porin [Methylobacterium marchantiae]|uniref:OprO/OprP family phosphate-selective porin n=1 Tax=Methylobacterium marchantiae TaxID=600331 RepID=A0ABW3WZP8_9HYPH